MPWKLSYAPSPVDPGLNVRVELPDGLKKWDTVATGVVEGAFMAFHHCQRCDGWIEGRPNSYPVDTLGPLCGHRGLEHFCRRCGGPVGFDGIVS